MLKGTLDDFTLPDVFRLTFHARKTGRLDVERRSGSGRVYFREGEVYFAESTKSKEPLGQKLVRARALTQQQLERALAEQSRSGARLGEILVDSGFVSLEQIEACLRSQIEDAVFDLLRWDLGAFTWEPDASIEPDVYISVSVENLIMEAARRLDELTLIKRKIPSPDIVLVMAPTPPQGAVEINITSEEWRVLVLVDGQRSVADIAALAGLDAWHTTRTLYGLMSAGLITQAGAAAVAAPGPSAEEGERPGPPPGPPSERAPRRSRSGTNVVELQPEGDPEQRAAPPAPPRKREQPAAKAPGPAPVPRVDRAAAVRELAALFNDEQRPRPRAVTESGRPAAEPRPKSKSDGRQRVEDENLDQGSLARVINGLKDL